MTDSRISEVSTKIKEILLDCPPVLAPSMRHLSSAEGKNIRSTLLLASASPFVGPKFFENARLNKRIINLAAAVELLHLSTLVHDDIIDEAPVRRGIASVQQMFGQKMAVLVGDYLFTKCFSLVSESNKERLHDFARATAVVCTGEALQHQFCKNTDIRRSQYYKIIMGKTAALFALALYGGASTAGANEKIARRLGRAGYYMGMVFQMVDDCLDYEGDVSKTKKNLFKDLEQGVITYPLIYTLERCPDLKSRLYKSTNGTNATVKMTDNELMEIILLVKEHGGLEAAKAEAFNFYTRSRNKINEALPSKNKDALFELLDLIYYREQ